MSVAACVAAQRGRVSLTPTSGGGGEGATFLATCDFNSASLGAVAEGTLLGDMQMVGAQGTIVSDATSTGGLKSLRMDWTGSGTPGSSQLSGVYYYGGVTEIKKFHARFRYKMASGTNNQVIKKTLRWRTYENINAVFPDTPSNDVDAGVLDVYTGPSPRWQFSGGIYSQDPYLIYQGHGVGIDTSSYAPDSFINNWRWVEAMVDYTTPNHQKFKLWVDETLIIDYDGDLTLPPFPPIPPAHGAPWCIKDIHFLGQFNDPISRQEWIDDLAVSDAYIGVP